MPTIPPTIILGAGRLGTALATHLFYHASPPLTLWNRHQKTAPIPEVPVLHLPLAQLPFPQAEIIILSVNDDAIAPLAQQLLDQNLILPQHRLLHCSGIHDANLLRALQPTCQVASFHPLQPISTARAATAQPPLFKGIHVGIEGDPDARTCAQAIVTTLQGSPFSLQGVDRHLYHAAAVFASNYVVTLAAQASLLMQTAGLQQDPLPLLLPLLQHAIQNLQTQSGSTLPKALTGPIARADQHTIAHHLQAIHTRLPDTLPLYQALAHATIPIASQSQPLTPQRQQNLQAIQSLLHPPQPHTHPPDPPKTPPRR